MQEALPKKFFDLKTGAFSRIFVLFQKVGTLLATLFGVRLTTAQLIEN